MADPADRLGDALADADAHGRNARALFAFAAFLACLGGCALHSGHGLAFFAPSGLFAGAGAISAVWCHRAVARMRDCVRRSDDTADVPHLIEIERRVVMHGVVHSALVRLLPRCDLATFSGHQAEWIGDMLESASTIVEPSEQTIALTRAILDSVARSGDASMLDPVVHLACRRNPLLREPASEALAALKQRLAAQRDAATLLRPASGSGENTLLRPAGHVETDEALLVRPAVREGDAVNASQTQCPEHSARNV